MMLPHGVNGCPSLFHCQLFPLTVKKMNNRFVSSQAKITVSMELSISQASAMCHSLSRLEESGMLPEFLKDLAEELRVELLAFR